jgi:hypothetical protein
MPTLTKTALRTLTVVFLGFALIAGVFAAWRSGWGRTQGKRDGSLAAWRPISGHWTERAGILANSNYGRGDMLIARRPQGTNYRISADLRFDLLFSETQYGDAGLVIRTTDPEQGVDSYQGYYAGLRPAEQTVVLGRASYDWRQLEATKLSTPVSEGTWYHLELAAQGCRLTVTATPDGGRPATRIDYQDNKCLTEGVAGLRSFYAQASWRDVKIEPN